MEWQANAGGGSEVLVSLAITGALSAIVPLIIAFLMLQRYSHTGLTALSSSELAGVPDYAISRSVVHSRELRGT